MLRRNWITVLAFTLLAPPLLFCAAIPFAMLGLFERHPERIAAVKDMPEVLRLAFEGDDTLHSACEVWQFQPLPDRKCVWLVKQNSLYVDHFISTNQLVKTQISHPKAKTLMACIRPDWERPDDDAWDWFTTEKYGEEHLEGQVVDGAFAEINVT